MLSRKTKNERVLRSTFPFLILGGLVAAICTSLIVGIMNYSRTPYPQSPNTGSRLMQSGLPAFYDAIETSEEALQKSLERFPAGHNPHGEVVRLLDASTYATYGGMLTSDITDTETIWVVGLLGDNLTVDDVLLENAPIVPEEADQRAAIGAKYVWSATRSSILADLVLLNEDQYDAIVSLPNQSIPITPAPFPTLLPTFTPVPTSTRTPTPTATP